MARGWVEGGGGSSGVMGSLLAFAGVGVGGGAATGVAVARADDSVEVAGKVGSSLRSLPSSGQTG